MWFEVCWVNPQLVPINGKTLLVYCRNGAAIPETLYLKILDNPNIFEMLTGFSCYGTTLRIALENLTNKIECKPLLDLDIEQPMETRVCLICDGPCDHAPIHKYIISDRAKLADLRRIHAHLLARLAEANSQIVALQKNDEP